MARSDGIFRPMRGEIIPAAEEEGVRMCIHPGSGAAAEVFKTGWPGHGRDSLC